MDPYSTDDIKRRKRRENNEFLHNLFEYVDDRKVKSKKRDPKEFKLKSENANIKFCGITSVDRTPLFASKNELLFLLEWTNNIHFIASSILGGALDKVILKTESGGMEKCLFLEKNDIIYILCESFPDKKGKWLLEQIAEYFSELVRGKDVNHLRKIDKYYIEKKFREYLHSVFKESMQLQDEFSDQEIYSVENWIRIDYVGLSSMSIGIMSILLDDDENLNVRVPGEFEDSAEEVEMKGVILTAKFEAIAASMLSNMDYYPRLIAVKLGFQKYRYIVFRRFNYDFFLTCLAEGNLEKLEELVDIIEFLLEPLIKIPFSGDLREFNKLKAKVRNLITEVSKKGVVNLKDPIMEELKQLIAKRAQLGQRLGSEDLEKIKKWEDSLINYYKSELRKDNDDDDNDFYPYPFIFKPPKPPDDFEMAAQVKIRPSIKEKDVRTEKICQYCGMKLTQEDQLTHSCRKKPKKDEKKNS